MNFEELLILTERHLDTILTYGLPFLFVVVDTIMKLYTGQKDFSSLPADASMAGLALYAGTSAVLLAKQVLPGTAAVSALLWLVPCLVAWFSCLKLAERHRMGKPDTLLLKPDLPSLIVGALVVSFCWNGSRYLLNHFSISI